MTAYRVWNNLNESGLKYDLMAALAPIDLDSRRCRFLQQQAAALPIDPAGHLPSRK